MKSPEITTTLPLTAVPPREGDTPTGGKTRLVRELLRPYRGWLVIILLAMLVETAMSLAAPWPLKVILDNVVGTHKAPEWLAPFRSMLGENKMAACRPGGYRDCAHRRPRGCRILYRQLLHGERRPVGGARSAHAGL